MLRQNIRLFFRSITRHRLHFLLTASGLIIGLTAVLLAYVFIQDEYQFDAFHTKGERIFRVNKTVKENNGDLSKNAETPGKMAATLDADFPEIELATHLAPWFNEVLVSYQDQNTFVKKWVFADSNFFQVFDFQMIKGGNPTEILSTPGQILITPDLAQTLFGGKDPIGKIIKGQNDKDFMVAGLVAPAPRQSHIQYDALVSWGSTESQSNFMNFSFMNNWLGQTVYTYLLLRKPEQLVAVNEKFVDFTAQYMANRKDTYAFFLQPLSEIYLQSTDLQYLRGGKYGSAAFLRTFSIIAFLILLIACFNYINIRTAKSLQRAKEVGVRKVLGASVLSIIGLLSSRFVKLVVIALLLATPIVYYYTNDWLNGFAYRVNLSWWVFIMAGLSVLGIVLLTISIQSVKAAIANPIQSLKSE